MTRNATIEKKLAEIHEANRKITRRVAKRLLGVKEFQVLRPTISRRHPSGWKAVKMCGSREEAQRYVRRFRWKYWLIEEKLD